MTRRPAPEDIVAALFIVALSAALLALAYIGLFTRYMADDYCTAVAMHKSGFVQSQLGWYAGWTGRFSFSFVLAAAESVGPAIVPFLPASAIACWLLASVWSVYRIALLVRWPRPLLTSLVIGELIVFATLNGAHNIAQSLYWQSGLLTYIPPLILFTFYVAVTCRGLERRLKKRAATPELLAGGLLAFIAGGFSESYALLQVGALLLALVACYRYAPESLRRAALPLFVAGLVGALLAACVVALAPGNAVRMGYFPAPPNLIKLMTVSLYDSAGFIAYTIYLSPLTTLVSVALPALLGFYLHHKHPDRSRRLNLGSWVRLLLPPLLIGFVLIFLCTVPAVYGTSGFLPERARIIPQFILTCVAVWWGCLAGIILSERFHARLQFSSWLLTAATAALVILLLPPVAATRRTLALAAGAKVAAARWDEMDRSLRAARERGVLDMPVVAVDDVETRFGATRTELQIEHDAQNVKNRCVACYYGLNSVRAE